MEGIFILKSDSQGKKFDNLNVDALKKFEITRHFLPKDTLFYVYPQATSDSLRSYYIESGNIKILETGDTLQPGDMIVCNELQALTILHFLTDVSLLSMIYNEDPAISFDTRMQKMDLVMNKIQEKDAYTKGHCDRVTNLVKMMGLALGYKSQAFNYLNKAARFHDLGKIFVPDEILNKPALLSRDEYEVIKHHPNEARILLENLFDEDIMDIIDKHHETLDGKGYPRGLTAPEIREEARIIAICDSFDAMTTDRVYKKGISHEDAFIELRKCSGTRYDPKLVDLFIQEYCRMEKKI